jgi:hypothetical protein
VKCEGTGEGHSIAGHEGPEGAYIYSSALSLTLALEVVGGQRHTLAALPPGMTRYQLYRRLYRREISGFERNSSDKISLFFPPFSEPLTGTVLTSP